jgi:arylsulfatase A-like enzyme/Tfp pilus assembly protein PilF
VVKEVGAAAAFAAALLLAAAAADPAARQSSARPNVVLLTLDTLRADRLGAYGYKPAATPNLDRLAREGIRFDDATTQSPLTGPAHTALLTGQIPTRLGIKTNAGAPIPEGAVTLAEALKTAGYRTGGFVGAFVLDRQYGFAQGFDAFDAEFRSYRAENKTDVQRSADEVLAPALKWIAAGGSAPGGQPFFAWLHFYDAHTPYAPPPPYRARFAGRPYDGEIAYVDAAVGRVLAALTASGQLERTIVVAVADHGESLGEHGEEEHGIFLYEPVIHIPWIVRLPNRERAGAVVAEQVRSIDLLPTLIDLTGGRAPAGIDGESLAAVMRGQPRRDPPASYADAHYPQLNFGWSLLRSLRVGEWKYIDAPKPELYDLRADRAERRNALVDRANVAARMASELQRVRRTFGAAAEAQAPQPDPETLARLRSLGYVGIAAPSGTATGADPKDKIADFTRFKRLVGGAIADLSARRPDAALQQLKAAVAINERAYDVHVLLGDAWMQKRVFDRALGEYDAAAVLNPDIASPHILAAQAYIEQGLFDRALQRLDAASRIEPRSGEIAFARGRVFERAGRGPEALAEYQRALALNPSDINARARVASVAMTLRQFDVAEPHLRVLLAARHQLPRTHYALGVVAEARGDRAAAAREYRRAVTLDPAFQPARDALARVSK